MHFSSFSVAQSSIQGLQSLAAVIEGSHGCCGDGACCSKPRASVGSVVWSESWVPVGEPVGVGKLLILDLKGKIL